MIDRLLRNLIREGELDVRLPNGDWIAIGSDDLGCAPIAVAIRDNRTLRRILADPGEAYMHGTLTKDRAAAPLTRDYITDADRGALMAPIAAE